MSASVTTGQVVWADFGAGPVLALFVKAGDDKDTIQAPSGDHVKVAYREPGDRDAAGSGLTWWKV